MAAGSKKTAVSSENVWRIGDIVGMTAPRTAEPWPERRPGEAFWFVAHTAPGFEKRLAADIKALGFSSYVPVRTVLRRRPPRGKAVRAEYPLFPRYVFFEIVPHPRCWAAIRGLRDLTGILANQDVPAHVSDETIGDIMAAEDMKLFDETVGPGTVEFMSGDRVSIMGGYWTGYEAVVQSPQKRSAVLRVVGPRGDCNVKIPLDLLRIVA